MEEDQWKLGWDEVKEQEEALTLYLAQMLLAAHVELKGLLLVDQLPEDLASVWPLAFLFLLALA
jgi:hypothetical protein